MDGTCKPSNGQCSRLKVLDSWDAWERGVTKPPNPRDFHPFILDWNHWLQFLPSELEDHASRIVLGNVQTDSLGLMTAPMWLAWGFSLLESIRYSLIQPK